MTSLLPSAPRDESPPWPSRPLLLLLSLPIILSSSYAPPFRSSRRVFPLLLSSFLTSTLLPLYPPPPSAPEDVISIRPPLPLLPSPPRNEFLPRPLLPLLPSPLPTLLPSPPNDESPRLIINLRPSSHPYSHSTSPPFLPSSPPRALTPLLATTLPLETVDRGSLNPPQSAMRAARKRQHALRSERRTNSTSHTHIQNMHQSAADGHVHITPLP